MGKSTDNGVTFFINRQMLDTEGKRSIHGNIVINGDRRKFSTGLRISEKIWDAKCNQAKGHSPEAQRINISLIKIREIIENLKVNLLLKDGFVSAVTVRDAYVELSKTPEKIAKEEAIKKVKEEEEQRKVEEERERKELEENRNNFIRLFRYIYRISEKGSGSGRINACNLRSLSMHP